MRGTIRQIVMNPVPWSEPAVIAIGAQSKLSPRDPPNLHRPLRAFPVTPPDMRVRIRRFGEAKSGGGMEGGETVGGKPHFGEDLM